MTSFLRSLAAAVVLILFMAIVNGIDAAEERNTTIEDRNRDTAGGSGYSIFFTPASHVAQLLDEGELEAANEVYVEQNDYFTENEESNLEIRDRLARETAASLAPSIKKAKDNLKAVSWPASPKEWKSISSTIIKTDEIIYGVDAYDILKNRHNEVQYLDALKVELSGLKSKLEDTAVDMFSEYPILDNSNFFDQYPIILDAREFLVTHESVWMNHLEFADIDQLLHLNSEYGKQLPDSIAADLGKRYYKTIISNDVADAKPGFGRLIQALNATLEAGLTLEEIPDGKVAFIQVTSRTLLDEGEIEFPISINVDVPFETAAIGLARIIHDCHRI